MAEDIWSQTFKYLADNNVLFEGFLLKPSIVTPVANTGMKVSQCFAHNACLQIVDLVLCFDPLYVMAEHHVMDDALPKTGIFC